jgi:hypothetical protein
MMPTEALDLFADLPTMQAPPAPARPRRSRAAEAGPPEAKLELIDPPRVRFGRPVQPRPEHPRVYQAILLLRRRGLRVTRSGAYHCVEGRLLNTKEMLARAAAVAVD